MSTITKHHRCSVRLGRARSGSVRKTTGTTMTNKSRYDNVRSFSFSFSSSSSSSSSSSFREDLKTNEEEEEEEEEEVDAGKAMRTTRRACVLKSGVVATSGFWIVENRRARAEDERNMAEDYDAYSQTYDNLDGNKIVVETLGIDQLRTKMFERVEGDVLELAVGTGLNLPYYYDKKEGRRRVKSLTAIDLSSGMLKKAEEKFRELERDSADNNNVKFELANVESLPYKDETFDYVVDTFSMCVFEKPDVALQEAKRVLKKGGKLLLFEHSRAKANTVLSAYQHATSGMVKRMAKGCDWSQDVEKIVREAGFTKVTWGPFEQVGGLIEALEVQK